MRKTRSTENKIVAAIQKQENGMSTREVCRALGIAEPTFYQHQWQQSAGTQEKYRIHWRRYAAEGNGRR